MKDKKISRLFYALAQLAGDGGMEFSLSLEDFESSGQTMNGFLTDNHSKSNNLVLRCWWPEPTTSADGEAEDGGEDDDEED